MNLQYDRRIDGGERGRRHSRSYIQDTVRLNLDGLVCRTPYFSTLSLKQSVQ
jgi:hypothetical protein